jgi:GT2 family glycosyltransferase
MPEVSIILPTYDRLPLLKQAIASVQAQQFQNWELIVVDDGSSDGSGDFVSRLGDARCHLQPERRERGAGRNAGLAGRSADTSPFSTDDLWLPGKLAAQIAVMRSTGAPWSYTGYQFIDEAGNEAERRAGRWTPLAGRIVRQVLTMEADVCIQSVLVERLLLERVGPFNEDPALVLREDYELVLRLAAAADVGVVDEPLVLVREHSGRSTRAAPDPFDAPRGRTSWSARAAGTSSWRAPPAGGAPTSWRRPAPSDWRGVSPVAQADTTSLHCATATAFVTGSRRYGED